MELDEKGLQAAEAAVQKWLDWCGHHGEEPDAKSGATVAIQDYLASTLPAAPMPGVKATVRALTYDEVEAIIEATEPPYLSDKGDRIWTRRMAVALADTFNCRLSSLDVPAHPEGVKAALERLLVRLADFDNEVAEHLANETERADLWEEIDVSVSDLRAVLNQQKA